MIVKILLFACYVRWTYEIPISKESHSPAQRNITLQQTKNISSAIDPTDTLTLDLSKVIEHTHDDEITSALTALREHTSDPTASPENDFNIILDDNFLYHSITNPLSKSKSWNLFPPDTKTNTILGDITKFSTPFKSSWFFLPKIAENASSENTKPSGKTHYKSVYRIVKINNNFPTTDGDKSSILGRPYDPSFSPSNLRFKFQNLNSRLNSPRSSIDILRDFNTNRFSSDIDDSSFSLPGTAVFGNDPGDFSSSFGHRSTSPENNSFYAYNVEEVKSPKGELQGVMQVLDQNGINQKIHYNQNGIVNKTVSNVVASANATKNGAPKSLGNSIKNTVEQFPVRQGKPIIHRVPSPVNHSVSKMVTSFTTKKPDVQKISVQFSGHNTGTSNNVATNENTFGSGYNQLDDTENLLADLVRQLNNKLNTSPSGNAVRTDVQNSFHETVSESSFYSVKK